MVAGDRLTAPPTYGECPYREGELVVVGVRAGSSGCVCIEGETGARVVGVRGGSSNRGCTSPRRRPADPGHDRDCLGDCIVHSQPTKSRNS